MRTLELIYAFVRRYREVTGIGLRSVLVEAVRSNRRSKIFALRTLVKTFGQTQEVREFCATLAGTPVPEMRVLLAAGRDDLVELRSLACDHDLGDLCQAEALQFLLDRERDLVFGLDAALTALVKDAPTPRLRACAKQSLDRIKDVIPEGDAGRLSIASDDLEGGGSVSFPRAAQGALSTAAVERPSREISGRRSAHSTTLS